MEAVKEADKGDLRKVRAMFGHSKKLKVSLTALTQTSRADRVATRQRPRLLGWGLRIVHIPTYTTAYLHRHLGQ